MTTPQSDTPFFDAEAGAARTFAPDQLVVSYATARLKERELNAAQARVRELEAREKAIIHFCEVEMCWEYFRAEFGISPNPTQTEQNANKLRDYLKQHGGLPATPPPPPAKEEKE